MNSSVMEWLKGYYPKKGKNPYNSIQEKDVMEWLDRNLRTQVDRDVFIAECRIKFDEAPLVKELNWLWREFRAEEEPTKTGTEMGRTMDVLDIHERYLGLLERLSNGVSLSNSDIDFMATWGRFETYVGGIMESDDSDKFEKAYNVGALIKSWILDGEQIPVVDLSKSQNPEAYLMAVKKRLTSRHYMA